jgi:hypothetical protein
MAIKKSEIVSVLAEIEADLQKAVAEKTVQLKKAAEDQEGGEDESFDGPASPPAAEDSGSPAAEASQSAPPPESASPAGPPPGEAGGAPADPAAGGQLDPAALQAEYAQLPPEELDMHIQAALAAKEALTGAAGGPPGASPGGMPPAGPPAGGPPGMEGSAPPPGMAMKNELKVSKEAIGGKVSKSEDAAGKLIEDQAALIKSLQAEVEGLKKSFSEDVDNLAKAMTKVIEQPLRKAVTSLTDVNFVNKTPAEARQYSKEEVMRLVGDNASRLTKGEREDFLGFIDNRVPAAKLAPMLERLVGQQK